MLNNQPPRIQTTTMLCYTFQMTKSNENITAHAGLAVVIDALLAVVSSRDFHRLAQALGLRRAKTAKRQLVSAMSLVATGGEHISEIEQLRADGGLSRLLGHVVSSATQLKDFLYRFHQTREGEAVSGELDRQLCEQGRAQIRPEGPALKVMEEMADAIWQAAMGSERERELTLEVDATIVKSNKKGSAKTYQGHRGYQPMVVYVAEKGLWVCDEFRDGNVPSNFQVLGVVAKAVGKVKPYAHKLRFRADAAFYNDKLMTYLNQSGVEFVISAVMSTQLKQAIVELDESEWHNMTDDDSEADAGKSVVQWAEVTFVPDASRNRKKYGQPLRYIAVRRPVDPQLDSDDSGQLNLFADTNDTFVSNSYRYFARVTNTDWNGATVIGWHNRKQGHIERGHDIVKNDLAGSVMPTARFGANAAWWRINLMVANLFSLLKWTCLPRAMRKARPKTLRFRLVNVAGRVVHHARTVVLKLASGLLLAKVLARARKLLRHLAEARAHTVC